mgnify:CR=1 FL=1
MNDPNMITGIDQLFEELDGGAFGRRLALALSDAALGVVATGDRKKKGKVTITFDIGQVGESNQVQIDHTIEFKQPTHRGSKSETHTTSTALYVGTRGKLTIMQNDTRDMFNRERDDA